MSLVSCSSRGLGAIRRTSRLFQSTFFFRSTSTTSINTDADESIFTSKQMMIYGASALAVGVVAVPSIMSLKERAFPATIDTPPPPNDHKISSTTSQKINEDNNEIDQNSTKSKTGEDHDDYDSPGPHNDFGAKPIENDPYAILPEEDEATTCSICNTFRKGPCRKYWRKTERCWKDTSDSEKCGPYSSPFVYCSQYYKNIYNLIMMDSFQEFVTELENDAESIQIQQFADTIPDSNDNSGNTSLPFVNVDWDQWIEFKKDFGPSFSQAIPTPPSADKKQIPLWERYPPDTEPILIHCGVSLPKYYTPSTIDGNTEIMMLDMAYVTDQDGFLISKFFRKMVESDATEDKQDEAKVKQSDIEKAESIDSQTEMEQVEANNSQTEMEQTESSKSNEMEHSNQSDGSQKTNIDTTPQPHDDDQREDGVKFVEDLNVVLLPGETSSIIVKAYYTKVDTSTLLSDVEENSTMVFKKRFALNKDI